MKIIEEGHKYELDNFESDGVQTLSFIKKVPTSPGSSELESVMRGTTNEEVLLVLIDRLYYFQNKMPCRENALIITKLEEAAMWLDKRAMNRHSRGVLGKNVA